MFNRQLVLVALALEERQAEILVGSAGDTASASSSPRQASRKRDSSTAAGVRLQSETLVSK